MKISTLSFVVLLSITGLQAQNQPGSDRIKEAKIRFFNEKLELSPSESKKFWPVYNDYQSRKDKLASERRNMMRYYNENQSNMTTKEISETLNRYIEIEQEEAELLAMYNEKFKLILNNDKVLKIYITEVQFRNHLLKQLRTRQQGMKPRQ